MNKTFRIIILSLFVAQSLVLYIVEGMLPVPFIAPGAKLGLANLITVIALYALPKKRDACLILLLRVALSTAFGGGINAFLYSAAGAAFSLVSMIALKRAGRFSLIGVSAAGGVFHNLGQVIRHGDSHRRNGLFYARSLAEASRIQADAAASLTITYTAFWAQTQGCRWRPYSICIPVFYS